MNNLAMVTVQLFVICPLLIGILITLLLILRCLELTHREATAAKAKPGNSVPRPVTAGPAVGKAAKARHQGSVRNK